MTWKEFRSGPGSFRWGGVGGQVGAGEVGVSGEGGALLTVHEETDFGDIGQVGAKRRADGEDGQGFCFEARGVAGGEGAGEIDDGKLIARRMVVCVPGAGEQENLVNGGCSARD